MGRRKNQDYWNQVTKVTVEENGKVKEKVKCKRCGYVFAGGVSRIRPHVDQIPGKGISVCTVDPVDEGVHNNVASGSSIPQEAMNAANSLQDVYGTADDYIGGPVNHQDNIAYGRELSGGVSRIKDHVNRTRKGIGPCPIDPDDEGVHNNVASGSSNPQEANSLQGTEEGRQLQDLIDSGYLHAEIEEWKKTIKAKEISGLRHNVNENNNVTGAFEEEINQLSQIISDLQRDEDDIKGQLQWLESRGKKRKREVEEGSVEEWLDDLQYLKRKACDMIQSLLLSDIEEFTEEVEQHKELKPLVLSNEIVGEDFEEKFKKVWELLKDDQVFIIGIYGMGGMGKTFLAKYVKDEIKRKGTWDVFWVKVSQNFSISKLQHHIAKEMGVKLDDEDDEEKRAEDLSSALETKEKSILVLDDVWKYIDLQKVGIPLRVNGSIKVILITRLIHVCQQMDCSPKNMIRIWPLNSGEGWELFLLKLGHQGTPVKLSSKVEEIAKSVVETCVGLPLAINVMARTMKGKLDDVGWWEDTLNKLNKGEMGEEMEEEVLKVLKLSYDNLVDEVMQNCFLYCALLPFIATDDLIMKLVEKGLINGMRSLEEIFAEGRTILGKLKDHFLLDDLDFSDDLSPERELMIYLACYIMKGRHQYAMFKYDKWLPCLQEWTTDLEMVSLMSSVVEIPGDMSPCCPKLSTLILCDGSISSIPECFFEHMNALTVLDLSRNCILTALPNSLSILKSLVSLVLRECTSLEYVPPLGDLQALSRLDISSCSLKEVPQGLETLIRLKWLDLSNNHNLTWVSGFVISGMTNMQYLDLRKCCIEITTQDIRRMKMLERFGGSFFKWDTYNQFVRQFQINGFGPKHFLITFGNIQNYWARGFEGKIVAISDCEKFGYLLLPRAFEELRVWGNNQWTCLCNGLSSEGTSSSSWKIVIGFCKKLNSLFCSAESCCKSSSHLYSTLESIKVEYCDSMKEIFANAPQPFPGAFSRLKHINIYHCSAIEYLLTAEIVLQLQNLESIKVGYCDSMKEIFANAPQPFPGAFSRLKNIVIHACDAIEYLLTAEIVPQLQNLETIAVTSCKSMKEVFAGSNNDEDDGPIIKLPELTKLWLSDLPELKMVCKGIIVCGSSMPSDIMKTFDCPKLERIPIIQRGTDRF